MPPDSNPTRAPEQPPDRAAPLRHAPTPVAGPWLSLPRLAGPIALDPASPVTLQTLSALIDLPSGSAMTLARIAADGRIVAARWRETGRCGWYPASTVKWVSAALMCGLADRLDLPADCTLELDADPAVEARADPPRTLRELILGSLAMSDNDFFCTLQEAVGFAHTYETMRAWGCADSLIRRHFHRPRFNHSRRGVICFPPDDGGNPPREPLVLEPRPAADIPLNDAPQPDQRESNRFTTDDSVRCVLATLCGPTRDTPLFGLLTAGLSYTNQRYVAEGLARVTAADPGRGGFVTLNKPGWWPPDGNNAEWVYIHDLARCEDYAMAIYTPGTNEEARGLMAAAAQSAFSAIRREALAIE